MAPDQRLDYLGWLHAWTAGAAYAGGQEEERGSLPPRNRADLVVVDGRLDGTEQPRVSETWVTGRQVYAAHDRGPQGAR